MASYIALLILLLILVFIGTRFRPAKTTVITDNLFSIRSLMGTFYAVRTASGVILFDTGVSPMFARSGLKRLHIPVEDVTHIFLTHTDFDHAGGLSAFTRAKVHLSKQEEQMINGTTPRNGLMRNRKIREYTLLDDGETLAVGGVTVRMHLTPGHTPGSASYLIGGKYLASGDLLRVTKKGEIIPFMRMMNMDHERDIQSVDASKDIAAAAEYVLTAHTGFKRN